MVTKTLGLIKVTKAWSLDLLDPVQCYEYHEGLGSCSRDVVLDELRRRNGGTARTDRLREKKQLVHVLMVRGLTT